MKIPAKYFVLAAVSAAVILLDQLTKHWVLQGFRLGESIPVIENFFNLTYVRNTGAAFGILAHADPQFRVPFFTLVPVIAIAAISYIFRRIPGSDLRLSAALSLVIGGAVGNLVDRWLWGYVVDFLDFHWKSAYHFPAFNVADMAICAGVAVLMLDLVTRTESEEGNASTPA